jgi:acetyl esterase/lipase
VPVAATGITTGGRAVKSIFAAACCVFGALPGGPVVAGAAEPTKVVELWPGKPPGDQSTIGEERWFQLKTRDGKPYEVAGRPTKWLTNVTKPALHIYRPARDKDTGVTMLICPGGGYHNLGWDVEGEEPAEWLTSVGITGMILKYRCPRRPGDVKGRPPIWPLQDAQRALSLVRSKAGEWGLDPKRVGMVGFSAGGHLCAAAAMNYDRRAYEPIDDVDRQSCRPDFAVSLYSGYLVGNQDVNLSADMRATKETPPILLLHAGNDNVSKVENSVVLYLALLKAGARAELHVYADGGHGWGVRNVGYPCRAWTGQCLDWLTSLGVLKR